MGERLKDKVAIVTGAGSRGPGLVGRQLTFDKMLIRSFLFALQPGAKRDGPVSFFLDQRESGASRPGKQVRANLKT